MHERALGVHEVELVVETRPCLGDSRSVGQHADRTVDRCEFSSGNVRRLLVVDSELESSRAPINEVKGGTGLESGNRRGAVTGDDVSTVEKGHSHVATSAGVAHYPKVGSALQMRAFEKRAHIWLLGSKHWKVSSETLCDS